MSLFVNFDMPSQVPIDLTFTRARARGAQATRHTVMRAKKEWAGNGRPRDYEVRPLGSRQKGAGETPSSRDGRRGTLFSRRRHSNPQLLVWFRRSKRKGPGWVDRPRVRVREERDATSRRRTQLRRQA